MGRLGTPEDVADAVAYLCGDGAGWVTGQVLTLDGGLLNAGGTPVTDAVGKRQAAPGPEGARFGSRRRLTSGAHGGSIACSVNARELNRLATGVRSAT